MSGTGPTLTSSGATSAQTRATPALPPDEAGGSRRWLIVAVAAIAQLMVVLDATIVNIALPSAQAALHFSNANRQWVVTGYALAFGSLVPPGRTVSYFPTPVRGQCQRPRTGYANR